MPVSKGKIRISRGPERCNNSHISQPPVDTKLPWPPPAPFIIQLDYTIAAYLQNKEKVFTIKHTHTHTSTLVRAKSEAVLRVCTNLSLAVSVFKGAQSQHVKFPGQGEN